MKFCTCNLLPHNTYYYVPGGFFLDTAGAGGIGSLYTTSSSVYLLSTSVVGVVSDTPYIWFLVISIFSSSAGVVTAVVLESEAVRVYVNREERVKVVTSAFVIM